MAAAMALSGCSHSVVAAQDSFAAEDAEFAAIEECLAAVEGEVRPALSAPPQFREIREAVTWTRSRLPQSLISAFNEAAVAVRAQSQDKQLADRAKDRESFERMLYSATVAELHKFKGCEGDDVIIVPDKLQDEFYLRLGLGNQPVGAQFAKLGLGDSYETKGVFMLMLTLDATGLEWNEQWFARARN